MNTKQVNILMELSDYELLVKEAAKQQMVNGKKTSVSEIIRNTLEPLLTTLRNGAQAPSNQDSSQDEIPPTSKDTKSFDFGDLKL